MLVTGRYRLVESIGQGGMGRVWRAADEMLDRPVAVKEMRIDGLDAEDTRTRRERTLREARATARIDHPNVVRVYDVVDEGERLWIVMELVVGRSLERMMVEEGPLRPGKTARIGLGLVAALRQVHARGVLHRDIKPGNVLVEGVGERIVLTDFGIAAIQDAKALTMVGMLVGSPDYMAPERISGRKQGPPSDVWSLGATLCAALGGRSPFSRDTTLATLHAVLYEEPELPAAAGPLRDVLAALLEKEPSVRPGLEDLEEALRPIAFPATKPTLPVGGGEGGEGAAGEARGVGAGSDQLVAVDGVSESPAAPGTGPPEGAEARGLTGVPTAPGTASSEAEPTVGGGFAPVANPEPAPEPEPAAAHEPAGHHEHGQAARPESEPAAEPEPGPSAGTDAPELPDAPGQSEPAPPIPWAPDESPTPAYLDARLVRAARDPRQPEPETESELDSIQDAIPQELPDTHDFRRDRSTRMASDGRTAAHQVPAASAATAPPSSEAPQAPAEPHEPSAYAESGESAAYAGSHEPSAHPDSHNASTEVPSELRSEFRSETPSAGSAPAAAHPGPPASRRSGVSLIRAHGVTEQRSAQAIGTGSAAAVQSGPGQSVHPGPEQGVHSGPEQGAQPGVGQRPQPSIGQRPQPDPHQGALPGPRQGPPPTSEQATRPALGPHPLRTPESELRGPAVPVGTRRSRRRAVLVAAAGVVAAGTVVVVVLLANSGSPGDNRAGSSTSPTSATTPGDSPSPTVEGTSRPPSLPPGTHREAGGFAWATPKDWRRDLKTGAEVHYTSPDGSQELVAKSSIARGDLMETWEKSEENAHQGQDYRKIRLEKTTFRGNPAVVWEYTFTLKGVPWHARLLGFNQEGKSYQINTWYQPEIETQALKTYDKVKDGFIVL